MKTPLVCLLLTSLTAAAPAALVNFSLSPPGTDAAVGLSPTNEVPAVTNSPGSGNVISGGIVFDTSSNLLHLAIGYGAAAGFTDLSGPVLNVYLQGSGPAGQNAPILLDLSSLNFPNITPGAGGVIFGDVQVGTSVVSNLLAGLDYINLTTATFTNGELRGQLIAVSNSAPVLTCPIAQTVECGTNAVLTATVSDPEGDALTIVWSVNGTPLQTNTTPASAPSTPANVTLVASLPLGTNVVGLTVTDTASNTVSCATMVTVVDTTPPVINWVKANPGTLWPPNHKMVNIRVDAQATDTCSTTTWKIVNVKSNEPVNGLGDGDTAPDWAITGPHTLQLRAERSGRGNGRVYTITIQAEDTSGNLSATKTTTVLVPKSQGKGK